MGRVGASGLQAFADSTAPAAVAAGRRAGRHAGKVRQGFGACRRVAGREGPCSRLVEAALPLGVLGSHLGAHAHADLAATGQRPAAWRAEVGFAGGMVAARVQSMGALLRCCTEHTLAWAYAPQCRA